MPLEDLDDFFDLDEFAVNVQAGEPATTLKAIFDNAYIAVEDGDILGVSATQPMLTCKSSDVATLEQGDPVTVSGVGYRVVDIQPDGTGISKVYLHRNTAP